MSNDPYGNYYTDPALLEQEQAQPGSAGSRIMKGVMPKKFSTMLRKNDQISQAAALNQTRTRTAGERQAAIRGLIDNEKYPGEYRGSNADQKIADALNGGGTSGMVHENIDGSQTQTDGSGKMVTLRGPTDSSGFDRLNQFAASQTPPGVATSNPAMVAAVPPPAARPSSSTPAPQVAGATNPSAPSSSPIASNNPGQGSMSGPDQSTGAPPTPAASTAGNPATVNLGDANNALRQQKVKDVIAGTQLKRGDGLSVNPDGSVPPPPVNPAMAAAVPTAPRKLNQSAFNQMPSSLTSPGSPNSSSAKPTDDDEDDEDEGKASSGAAS